MSPSSRPTFGAGHQIRNLWSLRGGDDEKQNYKTGSKDRPRRITSTTVKRSKATSASSPANPLSTYTVSICTAQGYRNYMEDEFFVSLDGDFAAVFDGHGGQAVSRYLRKNLYANVQAFLPLLTTTNNNSQSPIQTPIGLSNEPEDMASGNSSTSVSATGGPTIDDYEEALESALDKVDREVQRIIHWSYQGSTTVAIWIHEGKASANMKSEHENGDKEEASSTTESTMGDHPTPLSSGEDSSNHRTIIAANIGDSRAVLCRNDTAWDLTRDHKPNDPTEKSRIESLGGKVVWCGDVDMMGRPILERGVYRVNGNLALARAVGDRSERPHVTADPEIITVPVNEDEDDFIILATDGLWDVMNSQEAVDLVLNYRRMQEQQQEQAQEQADTLESRKRRQDDHEKIASYLVDEALRRGTYDNITVVIIWLDRSLSI